MPLPRKFAHLLEIERGDVEAPDYLWLAYAVCALSAEGCGWGGWTIEAAFKADGREHPTGTGDRVLPAVDEQVCPRCGRGTFRTGATLRVVPSEGPDFASCSGRGLRAGSHRVRRPTGLTTRSSERRLAVASFLYSESCVASLRR